MFQEGIPVARKSICRIFTEFFICIMDIMSVTHSWKEGGPEDFQSLKISLLATISSNSSGCCSGRYSTGWAFGSIQGVQDLVQLVKGSYTPWNTSHIFSTRNQLVKGKTRKHETMYLPTYYTCHTLGKQRGKSCAVWQNSVTDE